MFITGSLPPYKRHASPVVPVSDGQSDIMSLPSGSLPRWCAHKTVGSTSKQPTGMAGTVAADGSAALLADFSERVAPQGATRSLERPLAQR